MDDLKGVDGDNVNQEREKYSKNNEDSSEISSLKNEEEILLQQDNIKYIQTETDEDIEREKTDDKPKTENKSEKTRKLITQRNLEEKQKDSDKAEKSEISNKSQKKSEKSEKSEKKVEKEKSEQESNQSEKMEEVPDDVIDFVNRFKKNSIFLLRMTGIFQGFEAVLNGVRFNIHKIDTYLEYAADLFEVDKFLFTEKIESHIKFGEGNTPWTKEELAEYIKGFYD